MGKSNAERQRKHRAKHATLGLVSISGFVPLQHYGATMLVLRRLQDDAELEIALMRNVRTGRLVKP